MCRCPAVSCGFVGGNIHHRIRKTDLMPCEIVFFSFSKLQIKEMNRDEMISRLCVWFADCTHLQLATFTVFLLPPMRLPKLI